MPQFVNGVRGLVATADLLDIGHSVARPNDPIDTLFEDIRTENILAMWHDIAAEMRLPVMAQYHAFDVEAKQTVDLPIDVKTVEKGLIKVKKSVSEFMRQLEKLGLNEEQQYDEVLKFSIRMADQVSTRSKVAKNEVMATGKMTIKENGINNTLDYGVPSAAVSHTISFADGADVLAQIQAIIAAANKNGVIINGIYTSSAMLAKIRGHKSVQAAVGGNNTIGALVKKEAFNDLMASEYGINTVLTNDLRYNVEKGVDSKGRPVLESHRYYPENKITFFAAGTDGQIGKGLWGDPPEVDLENPGSGFSGEQPFVYMHQWKENDPAVLWEKASALFVPVLPDPNSIYIATGAV